MMVNLRRAVCIDGSTRLETRLVTSTLLSTNVRGKIETFPMNPQPRKAHRDER